MNTAALHAISPIDGRYSKQVASLSPYFSEAALMRYRVRVEIAYLLHLAEQGIFSLPQALTPDALNNMWQSFSEEDALTIKRTEATTNHDVKAVEYFIK